MLAIYLLNHITLSFCEIVMSDQEYFIHDFSNFCDRADLKFFLHYINLCDIKTKKHAEAEILIKIK